MKNLSVTYLGGSGFFIQYGTAGFLLDACKNGADPRVYPEREILQDLDPLFVLISHHHDDHFDPELYDLCPEHAIYFLGYDIPEPYKGTRMQPGDRQYQDGLTVSAYDSTDDGVSFLIEYKGVRIFHAGDLNLWHWRDDSSIAEIEAAETAFYECMKPILHEPIDLAFFPVDPRQGSMYDAGAGYFLMNVKPLVMIPMHFQGRGDIALRFALNNESEFSKIVVLQTAGDSVNLALPEKELTEPEQKLKEFISANTEESTIPIPKEDLPDDAEQQPLYSSPDFDDEEAY